MTIGNELVSYNPSLFELADDDSNFFDDSSNIILDAELQSMLTTEKEKLMKSQNNTGKGMSEVSEVNTPMGMTPVNSPFMGNTPYSSHETAAGGSKRKRK